MSPKGNDNHETTMRLDRDTVVAARKMSQEKPVQVIDQKLLDEGERVLRVEIKQCFEDMEKIEKENHGPLTRGALLQNRYSQFEKTLDGMVEVGYLTKKDREEACNGIIRKYLLPKK